MSTTILKSAVSLLSLRAATSLGLLLAQPLIADDAAKPQEPPSAGKKTVTRHPFLGVAVSSVHPALAANLKDVLSADQGLTVEAVADGSPAAKAGVKVYDILTAYDDQKLFSAEQLSKLVHSDRSGRAVTLEILRNGKLQKDQVTLGEADSQHEWTPLPTDPFPPRIDRRYPRFRVRPSAPPDWDVFDKLTLKKLGNGKYRAEVQYIDKDGKTQNHVFEGTREEIRKAIESHNDLKPTEKDHLLRSLNLHGPMDDFALPSEWFEPRYGWFIEPPPANIR